MLIIINNNYIILTKRKITYFSFYKKFFYKIYKFFLCSTINSVLNDIFIKLKKNSSLQLIRGTDKKSLNVLRHSCAHLLAHSLKDLLNDIKLSIGPVIDNGFYYDFYTNEKISFKNLSFIEKKMHDLTKKNFIIRKILLSKKKIKELYLHNKYKLEIIDKINDKNIITIYRQNNFSDLCKGPHIYNLKFLKYFKLIKISGAYWKNNKNNEMLYRIYGTLWQKKNDLYKYIDNLNKIKDCDHRIIGKKLHLFDFYNHSNGVVFWNKNGWKLFLNIQKFIRNILKKNNYTEVNTPIMAGYYLFNKSGHIEKFSENIFFLKDKNNLNILKPMSCPLHITIFNNFFKKSYKNLPFRISEFGSCFRNELSGSLHGLMRLKNFTQDDGHIFCNEIQLKIEIIKFIQILKKVYFKFNFNAFKIVISKKPKNILDNLIIWNKAEKILEHSIKILNMNYSISNDGAFYGPKIEFSLRDNLNRLWQCGTIQVDFFTGNKLNSKYIDFDGMKKNPIILHRAILGSIERFTGVLLEHTNGYLPFWINPIQFKIVYISNEFLFYAKNIYNIMKNKYNIEIYYGNDRLEYKIKQCFLHKIPYIIIIGKNEYKNKNITIRSNKSNKIKIFNLKDFLKIINLNDI